MKPLTIEIHGTGTHNRGAELMAIAIAERMRATFPGVRLVVPPGFGDFAARSRHSFWTTCEFSGRFRAKVVSTAIRLGSSGVRSSLGVIDPAEIDIVLDASGFAFSDQWGPGSAKNLLSKMDSRPRRDTPLVLLPQALGPFKNPDVASISRQLFARASSVYARDDQSHAAAKPLVDPSKLRQSPDFTLNVSPEMPPDLNTPESFIAIVPNFRMLDKTGAADSYLSFLNRSISLLQEEKLNPVFVLHDSAEDKKVIEQVSVTHPLRILTHADPRVLKAILGRADFVIASRFHALVSSLSQGVPCIGAGWSHKYPELFRDFDCDDLLVDDLSSMDQIARCIVELAATERRGDRSRRISIAALELKSRSNEMWLAVEEVVRRSA